MKLVLVVCFLSGAYSLDVWGPAEVRGLVGDSLTVPCRYTAYDENVKYWCKDDLPLRCRKMVTTDGNTKNKRMSIIYNKTERVLYVTMTDLREEDDGWYNCGISMPRVFEFDKQSLVYISVQKVQAPEMVISQTKGTVTVRCKYHSSYTDNVKYWCKVNLLFPCSVLVKTDGSTSQSRISIRDDKVEEAFYVTMTDLTKDDEGSYLCGISKSAFDENVSVYVQVNEGATIPDLHGPANVIGQVSGSKTIRCQYSEEYTNSFKFWCKYADVDHCSPVVDTENKETEGRTQIRDDPSNREFLITIRDLMEEDKGYYSCGVKLSSPLRDKQVKVYLYVDAVNSKMSTTSKTEVELIPESTAGKTEKGNTISKEQQEGSTIQENHNSDKSLPLVTTLVISFGILLLLCCVTALIACTIKRQKRAALADKSEKTPGATELTYAEVITKDIMQEPSSGLYSNVNFQQCPPRTPPADQVVYSAVKH